jgi:hypothetical protein
MPLAVVFFVGVFPILVLLTDLAPRAFSTLNVIWLYLTRSKIRAPISLASCSTSKDPDHLAKLHRTVAS